MLKNNLELDIKVKAVQAQMTQAKLASAIGITPSYANRLIKNNENLVNKTFVKILETLGYDILLTYVKRDDELSSKAA
ncbi:helix-turn-helix domain-containing protein [Allobaculum mucilyticum]|uniref:helix-turn-helix domain-containing protein n=1 Tax=Allobaculum mucilyticum TaxID=2834459 RepID=UPI001E3D5FAD|nr:helix-turn-helix transcriptional regulator [Allobaculum mucilyticum]UNT97246.1 helix-turn-helix transcriptional regulator [Allobaculum mucilyticum]